MNNNHIEELEEKLKSEENLMARVEIISELSKNLKWAENNLNLLKYEYEDLREFLKINKYLENSPDHRMSLNIIRSCIYYAMVEKIKSTYSSSIWEFDSNFYKLVNKSVDEFLGE